MTLHNETLPAARQAVERLYGQCILSLQANEHLMKAMVAAYRFSASLPRSVGDHDDRAVEIAQKTMGALVSDMMGSLLVPQGRQGTREDRDGPHTISVQFKIAFPPEEFARIEAEHREVVQMRNALVHHFLEQNDLRTLDGCRVAQRILAETLDRIVQANMQLRLWAGDMEQSRKAVSDLLSSQDIRNAVAQGRIPLHLAAITQALHEALVELAADDWVPVDIAVGWIAKRFPDEHPENYGCKTWRQVIHEARCFDLQRRNIDGRSCARYRARIKLTLSE